DRECRASTLREDLRRESQNRAHFLARRMFENYLLNADGIAAVANDIEGFRNNPINAQEVSQLIDAKSRELRYYCTRTQSVPAEWLIEIDGAAVLKDIFAELSENRVHYDKVRHSVAITRWIISNSPEQLREISELLLRVLQN